MWRFYGDLITILMRRPTAKRLSRHHKNKDELMLRYITCSVLRCCWFLAQRKDQHGEHKAPTGDETRHFIRSYHVTFIQYREINDGEIEIKSRR